MSKDMSKLRLTTLLPLLVILLAGSQFAFAQNGNQTQGIEDVPITIGTSEALILLVGALGGLTTAYLGYRKAHSQTPDVKFSVTKFLDRVIVAVIVSIGLAIAAATNLLELNLFSLFLVFTSSLGTSELVMQIRNRNAK